MYTNIANVMGFRDDYEFNRFKTMKFAIVILSLHFGIYN